MFTLFLLLAFGNGAAGALRSGARSGEAARGSEFARGSAPAVLADLHDRAPGENLEAKARAVLAARIAGLGATPESGLMLQAIRRGKAIDVVRFRQTLGGIPVLRGGAAVSFDRSGVAIFVANDLKPVLGEAAALSEALARAPAIDAGEAERVALARLGVSPAGRAAAALAIFPGASGARRVWAVELSARDLYGSWEVLVDAESGAIVRVEDRALYQVVVPGQGQAFLPDPLASSGAAYGDPGYVDGDDADTSQLTGEISDVVFPSVLCFAGTCLLLGDYSGCWEIEDPVDACATSPDPDFRLPAASRANNAFEDMNAFFHLESFLRYVNVTLGIPATEGVLFDAHGMGGADNAYYNPATGDLSFGEGGVDAAEDPDVLIHELGHALHDSITLGNISNVQGLSEGTGDYFAASYSRAFFPGTWTPADPEWDFVCKWDGHNEFWPGRRLDWNDDHLYDTTLDGLPHDLGQFWSSCNLDIAEAIGYEETDTVLLEGLSMTGAETNQAEAAAAVMVAAEALGYSLAVQATMAELYNESDGGTGCNYGVLSPILIADFEENDFAEWSSHTP